MRRGSSVKPSRVRRALGSSGVFSLAALAVGLMADALNVVDVVQVELFGRAEDKLIRERFTTEDIALARKAFFLDRFAALCFDRQEFDSVLTVPDHYRIHVFHCGREFLAARVEDRAGEVMMSEIDLPAPPAAEATAGRNLLGNAWAQPPHPDPPPPEPPHLEPPPAEIVRALCQREEPGHIVVRYRLADGSCMDEVIDRRTGAAVERLNGVPCDCSELR